MKEFLRQIWKNVSNERGFGLLYDRLEGVILLHVQQMKFMPK